MKILMIRSTRSMGGTEIYNLNMIEALLRYKIKISLVYVTTLSDFSTRIKEYGTSAKFLRVFNEEVGTKKGLLRLLINLPSYLFIYLREFIKFKKDNFDLVCLQSATEKIVLSPFLFLMGYKVIWIEHGPVFSFSKAREVLLLYRLMSIFVKKVICVSQCTLEDELVGGISEKRLICIPTGINTTQFSPLGRRHINLYKNKFSIKQNEYVVGFVGRICEEKGVRLFLAVTMDICRKHSDYKILIVGDGPLLAESKELIKAENLCDRYIFTGFVKDVRPLLSMFNILFSATTYESLSMTLMQAMSMEIPVVTRDIWDNKYLVINGKTGLLFNTESVNELSRMIVTLINNKNKYGRMSKESRAHILAHFNEKEWIYNLSNELSKMN